MTSTDWQNGLRWKEECDKGALNLQICSTYIYGESILQPLDNVLEGISVNSVQINNIKYVDNTILIATSEEGLAKASWRSEQEYWTQRPQHQLQEDRCMVISKSEPLCLALWKLEIPWLNNLTPLTTSLSPRMVDAEKKYGDKQMKLILCNQKLLMLIKILILKTFTWSMLPNHRPL